MAKTTERGGARKKSSARGATKTPAKPKRQEQREAEGRVPEGDQGRQGAEGQGLLQRQGHHRARGPDRGPQAPRHVHRLDRPPRAAPPGLRGGRQLGRRGDRRPRHQGHRHPAPGQQRHGRRRRPRHPGREAPEDAQAGRRGRDDHAPRRRQVRRRRRLQGLGRPARRRRLGRQRALGRPQAGGLARRPRLGAALPARQAQDAAEEGPRGEEHRHHHHLHARPRDLRGDRVRLPDPRRAPARDRLPHPRPQGRADRRARRRREGGVPVQGRHRGLRQAPERDQGPAAPQDRLLRGRDQGGPGRGRDAVERLLPGVDLLLRQQHQHPRGRHPPLRLPLGADPDPQLRRPQPRPAEGEGRRTSPARTCARA